MSSAEEQLLKLQQLASQGVRVAEFSALARRSAEVQEGWTALTVGASTLKNQNLFFPRSLDQPRMRPMLGKAVLTLSHWLRGTLFAMWVNTAAPRLTAAIRTIEARPVVFGVCGWACHEGRCQS